MSIDPKQLAKNALALKQAGRLDEAIEMLRDVVKRMPASGVAEHNLAAALGDAERWEEAERHIRRAFAKGIDAPESWLVLGRAAMALSRFAEADEAFLQAIRRRPNFHDAQRDLAQLRWMRTGSLERALEVLDASILAHPQDAHLQAVKAKVLDNIGLSAESHRLLMRLHGERPTDPVLATLATNSALAAGDPDLAVRLGAEAEQLAPNNPTALIAYIEACLASGQPQRALDRAERLHAMLPNNQHAIALKAVAWRLLGDPRYGQLFEYQSVVLPLELSCPRGWTDLEAFLVDLAEALNAAHEYQAHPFDQSIKHGTQAASILGLRHPAIQALPEALDAPIRTYLDHIGRGDDPLRARNTGRYTFKGIWSIRMRSGGFHVNHIHPEGWISSACYVTVPKNTVDREGWIKFGEPRIATRPPCPPEHYVEPKPGRLVLFPSYMWHGTMPFSGDGVRTTAAMDVLPN